MSATATKRSTSKQSGATQRSKSKKGAQRRPDLSKLWRELRSPVDLNQQAFRAMLLRADNQVKIADIDGSVMNLDWRYDPGDPVMHGTLSVKPPTTGPKISIHDGHVLRLDLLWGGRWRELWRMRLANSSTALDGTKTFDLNDDAILLQENEYYWHFTKSKKGGHPHGWKCHQVVAEVARRLKIPLGQVAEGKAWITGITGKMTAMQVLQKAYAIERQHTSRRFVIRWEGGRLHITPLRRNPLLYVLGPMLEDGDVGRTARDPKFATAVTVTAMLKGSKGSHKHRKIRVHYHNPKAVAKDGWIHREISGGQVKSHAEAVHKAKRYIAQHSVRKPTLTNLTHRGIALLRRGDAIEVDLKQYGFHGKTGVCFVSAGRWSLNNGDFTMNLSVVFDDPLKTQTKAKRKAKDKATRAAKRAKK